MKAYSSHQFSFPASEAWARPFLRLLRGHREEIILRDPRQLTFILQAAEESAGMPGVSSETLTKLSQLKQALGSKMSMPGTKAQLKPSFVKKKGAKSEESKKEKKKEKKAEGSDDELTETERSAKVQEWLERGLPSAAKEGKDRANQAPASSEVDGSANGEAASHSPDTPTLIDGGEDSGDNFIPHGLEKMQLVVKWGGESTHSSRYQSRDLGDAFKKDIMIMSQFSGPCFTTALLTATDKDVLNNVRIYTSSERRVIVSNRGAIVSGLTSFRTRQKSLRAPCWESTSERQARHRPPFRLRVRRVYPLPRPAAAGSSPTACRSRVP